MGKKKTWCARKGSLDHTLFNTRSYACGEKTFINLTTVDGFGSEHFDFKGGAGKHAVPEVISPELDSYKDPTARRKWMQYKEVAVGAYDRSNMAAAMVFTGENCSGIPSRFFYDPTNEQGGVYLAKDMQV